MAELKILKRILLKDKYPSTSKTKHYFGDELLPEPHELRIVKYEGDDGYYLFYCNEKGEEFTDTYHDTIEEAQLQANWEFLVEPKDWEDFNVDS